MRKGFMLLLAVVATALFVGVAAGSSGKSYWQTPGSSPARAPHIKLVQITSKAHHGQCCVITIYVWLANRSNRNTKVGDNISIGLDRDAKRATGSSTGIDYVLSYTKHHSSHPVLGVLKWRNGKYHADLAFNKDLSTSLQVLPYGQKGKYLAWTFWRQLFGIGKKFHFWVATAYGCKGGKHSNGVGCHSGEYLPRAAKPGVLTYKVKS